MRRSDEEITEQLKKLKGVYDTWLRPWYSEKIAAINAEIDVLKNDVSYEDIDKRENTWPESNGYGWSKEQADSARYVRKWMDGEQCPAPDVCLQDFAYALKRLEGGTDTVVSSLNKLGKLDKQETTNKMSTTSSVSTTSSKSKVTIDYDALDKRDMRVADIPDGTFFTGDVMENGWTGLYLCLQGTVIVMHDKYGASAYGDNSEIARRPKIAYTITSERGLSQDECLDENAVVHNYRRVDVKITVKGHDERSR